MTELLRTRKSLKMLKVALLLFWIGLAVVGFNSLYQFESTAGKAARASAKWPATTALPMSPDHTLLLFIHPHCSCSRATLRELSLLVGRHRDNLETYVILVDPPGTPTDWAQSELSRSAREIPGVKVIVDANGVESKHFGAFTSGQALLYSNKGDLLFSGGVTSSRGHDGNNVGRSTIESIVSGATTNINLTPVFGCSLMSKRDYVTY